VALKKLGASWKGLCPFHQEKTPSFNVRSEPPVFHCFGCGEGGDVFTFVMKHERVGFPEAVETVARRFGVTVPAHTFEAGPERKHREELLALLEAAAQHFERAFWGPAGARARQYLLERGFTKAALERIRAGAALDSWSDLLDALKRRFPVASILEAGLVLAKQNGPGHYDRFRNRAVFPILNEQGQVVAFGARSLDGSEPKYLNSPETPAYQKGRVLYGLSWAREAIRQQGRVVLMEGYLDVARALQAGVAEAVATCGTALTPAHARLLRRFTERVVTSFDQDEAGQKATRKGLEVLAREGLKVQVVELPAGHDPDSFLREHGAEAYRERLAGAPSAMDWLIARAAVENDTGAPEGKAAFLNAVLPALAALASPVERAAWLARVVERGGLDDRAAREEVRRALLEGRASAPALPSPAAPRPAALLPAERWLLWLLAAGDGDAREAVRELEDADLRGLASEELLRAAARLAQAEGALGAASLGAAVSEEARRRLTELLVQDSPGAGVSPRECLRELKRRSLQARMAELQREIREAPPPEQDRLLREKHEIHRRMAAL
jgi:DNA primase